MVPTLRHAAPVCLPAALVVSACSSVLVGDASPAPTTPALTSTSLSAPARPSGTGYAVPINMDEYDTSTEDSGTCSATAQAAVLDGEAYFFPPCEG